MKLKLFFICFFGSFLLQGQSQKSKALSALLEQCEKAKNNEQYKTLIVHANKGLASSKNENYFTARFTFYKAYGYEYDNNQYKKAIPLYESSWNHAQKGKNLTEETLALMRLNYLYYSTKQFQKREALIAYIRKVLDTTKNISTQGILNGSLGEYYLDNSEFEKFIGYKLIAIEYRKKFPKEDVKNKVNIGISYSQIGQAYNKMKQYDKGIEYLNYAKPYLKESANSLAFLYNDYIKSYNGLKKIDSIQKYYTQIQKLVSKEDSLHICVSSANRYMAEYYISVNQIAKAAHFSKKAALFAKKSNDDEILMEANISEGKVYFKQKQFEKAIETLKKASPFSFEFDKESFIVINKLIAESYAQLKNWDKAYEYQSIYAKANEKMLQESAKQSIANAEAKYQNRNKQEKINLLSAENQVKNLQIENNRKNQIYLTIGFVLLLIIAALLYKQNQNRRKSNERLQLLNEELDQANKIKARFFSILNHDLRSPVSNLIHFLHLQKEHPELLDDESKERLESKTISGAENLLSSMEDLLLWSKSQMDHFNPQPKSIKIATIFEAIATHFSNLDHLKFEFENPDDLELITDENYLKTIVRNLTGNAVKALEKTENPQITWKATRKDSQILLTITDNGPGSNMEQFKALYDDKEVIGIKSGLGLHLIRDLAKAIHCDIEVTSKINEGTSFTLTL